MANPKNYKKERAQQIQQGGAALETKFQSKRGEAELNELEELVDRLEREYMMYFNGISNIDPGDKRFRANKLISRLHEMHIRNPATKFRLQSVLGKYVALKAHWDRNLKEMAEGVFQRDIFRANVKERQAREWKEHATPRRLYGSYEGNVPRAPEAWDVSQTSADDEPPTAPGRASQWRSDADASTGTPTNGPSTAARAWNAGAAEAGPSQVDRVHQQLVAARQAANLPPVSREAVERTIEEQRRRIMEQYRCADVDFKVETREGKVVLKPVAMRKRDTEAV